MKKLGVLIGLLLLSGCGEPPSEVRYNHVVRIMMHEKKHFTIFTQAPESKELSTLEFRLSYQTKPRFIADAEEGQGMWIRAKRKQYGGSSEYEIFEFHIYSSKDIEGGGWNHGKGGRGQTQVIE